MKKIVVIGPECTGKSTLSEALAKELGTVWVPEHARKYLELLKQPYTENDLLEISKGQLEHEEQLMKDANKFLICDTDLYVIKVWSEHSYHRCNRRIIEQIAERSYDLYLLTDIDMPWVYDPLREHEASGMRNYFYQQYKDIMMNSGVLWTSISGSPEQRLARSLEMINSLSD